MKPSFLRAFSLVEVTLALGIVAFALVSIMGLLPVGLRTVKNSHEQSAAATTLEQIASAIRNATTNNSGTYTAGAYSDVFWTTNDNKTISLNNLAFNGQATNGLGARLNASVHVTAPTNATSKGIAVISVAWPTAATATWSTTNGFTWTNAQGALSSTIIFLPKP